VLKVKDEKVKLSTYEDWKRCITVDCGIELTSDFIDKRLTALNDLDNYHTQKFKKNYGAKHLKQVIGWFKQAKGELV